MKFKFTSKNIKLIVAVTCLSVFITGCTPANNTTNNGNTNTGSVTIQWWGTFWDQSVVDSLITEYEQANSGVQIEYVNKWTSGDSTVAQNLYETELKRVLKNNNAAEIPDLFAVPNTSTGNYIRYAAAAPTSLIDANTVATAYYPAVTTDFVQSGNVYGLPLWMDTLAIVYNQDLITQNSLGITTPPQNWNDFKNLSINLTTRVGQEITRAGFAAGIASNVDFAPELLYLLMLQNGVRLTDVNNTPIFANTDLATTALDFYKSFASSGGSWNSSLDNASLAFLNKKAVMIAVPSWRLADILKFNETYDLGLRIGVAGMPQILGQTEPTLNWATYWGNMVSNARPNSAATWAFLNWLSKPEQLRKLAANDKLTRDPIQMLYPRTDMAQELQRDQYLRVYNSALSAAKSWRMVDGAAVNAAFEQLLNQSSSGASQLSGTQTTVTGIVNNAGRF